MYVPNATVTMDDVLTAIFFNDMSTHTTDKSITMDVLGTPALIPLYTEMFIDTHLPYIKYPQYYEDETLEPFSITTDVKVKK